MKNLLKNPAKGGIPAKENIAKAQRIWKKLSEKEQQLAIDHIEEYYYHQTNMKFTLHACSYLSNKAFLNEYEY